MVKLIFSRPVNQVNETINVVLTILLILDYYSELWTRNYELFFVIGGVIVTNWLGGGYLK